jgi:sec-independent protein translocase protein TatA
VPNIGVSELIVILMILLLVFGASRLPALGEGLGRTIRGFKRGISDDNKAVVPPAPAEAKDAAKPAVARKETDASDAELIDKS